MTQEESRIESNSVFGFTLFVVIPSLIGLVFPALIVSLFFNLSIAVDPFEFGHLAIPFLTTNIILLGFGILYYKKNLPDAIFRSIKFIRNFEVSRKVAIIVLVTLFAIYIGFTVNELYDLEEDTWPDFVRIQQAIEEFPYNKTVIGNVSVVYVKNFILWTSHNILDNIRILPFVCSISLLLLTYFFTVQLTKKRFAGIIAVIIIMQSSTFLIYDTSATYSYFWTFFYVLSLYVINKRIWYFSHIIYILSLFSKPLSILFLPMTMYFTRNAKIPSKRKIFIITPYSVILGAVLAAYLLRIDITQGLSYSFDYVNFWLGFSALSVELRDDAFILVFLLPLIVGLFFMSRRGMTHANSVLFLIMGSLLMHALLSGFTFYNLLPYRYLPFIVFFAVGVGTLFSKKITQSA